jgi:hypothetical protein
VPNVALHNSFTYIALGTVFVLALIGAWLVPAGEVVKGLVSLPGVGALFAAIFQLARDEARYEKDAELQRIQQTFSLGISSHMSRVVFDKHVEFCERYMKEVDEAVTTLFREGPSEGALSHADALYNIRREFSAWVTARISERLEPFERTLRQLGADSGFVRSTTGVPGYADQRSKLVERMYDTFKDVLDLDSQRERSEIAAVEAVKGQIREILGIEQLTLLRHKLLRSAISNHVGT